ncbi:MAG TPA: hypothetical protein VK700_01700 [Steroidobacteraceae bacterium]|jgi:hypothetical protein|nr:hypothetical protein [Steroidobacteraceae bacterium]
MKTTVALCLVILSWAAGAAQPPSGCDRECLRGTITRYLYALLKHDTSKLPLADNLRVTEDAIEKPLAKVSILNSVTSLRGYRQDFLDERAGVAGADVVVLESGAPLILVVRIKVVAEKITEIETVSTRTRAEGLSFNIDGLSAPSEEMNFVPRPEQLATREKAIEIAMHYPKGLNNADTFAAVGAPFTPDAYRLENGAVMAGAACVFTPTCKNISTQSLAIFKRIGPVTTRLAAVDERLGIVWLRMAWNVRDTAPDKLTVWEAFKVYDGQIHAVEAFMRILPPELANGGWN